MQQAQTTLPEAEPARGLTAEVLTAGVLTAGVLTAEVLLAWRGPPPGSSPAEP